MVNLLTVWQGIRLPLAILFVACLVESQYQTRTRYNSNQLKGGYSLTYWGEVAHTFINKLIPPLVLVYWNNISPIKCPYQAITILDLTVHVNILSDKHTQTHIVYTHTHTYTPMSEVRGLNCLVKKDWICVCVCWGWKHLVGQLEESKVQPVWVQGLGWKVTS